MKKASGVGNLEIVTLLLSAKSDIQLKNRSGNTALHMVTDLWVKYLFNFERRLVQGNMILPKLF